MNRPLNRDRLEKIDAAISRGYVAQAQQKMLRELEPEPVPHPDDAPRRIDRLQSERDIRLAIARERNRFAIQWRDDDPSRPPPAPICSARLA